MTDVGRGCRIQVCRVTVLLLFTGAIASGCASLEKLAVVGADEATRRAMHINRLAYQGDAPDPKGRIGPNFAIDAGLPVSVPEERQFITLKPRDVAIVYVGNACFACMLDLNVVYIWDERASDQSPLAGTLGPLLLTSALDKAKARRLWIGGERTLTVQLHDGAAYVVTSR